MDQKKKKKCRKFKPADLHKGLGRILAKEKRDEKLYPGAPSRISRPWSQLPFIS